MTRFDRLCLLVACLAIGCVSPTTTLQTARPVAPGHVEAVLGGSVPVHGAYIGALSDVISSAGARVADARDEPLTEQEHRDALRGALAAVLFQPSLVYQLELRTGVLDGLDVGLRIAGPSFKGDLKYAVVQATDYDLALSVGYVHHTGVGASAAKQVFDVFEQLKIIGYDRYDIDAAAILSGSPKNIVSGYGALRYVAGFASLETELPPELLLDGAEAKTDTDGVLHTVGATAGLRLGSERFAFLAELGLMWVLFEPTILGEPVDFSGVLITPALAFDGRF